MRTGWAGHDCASAAPDETRAQSRAGKSERTMALRMRATMRAILGLLLAPDVLAHHFVIRVLGGDERHELAALEDALSFFGLGPLQDGPQERVAVSLGHALVHDEQRVRDASRLVQDAKPAPRLRLPLGRCQCLVCCAPG